MKKNEKFYDKEIAPELLRLSNLCKDRGMSFICCVEYDAPNQGIGRTEVQQPDKAGTLSAAQRLTHWAARSQGNVDTLIWALIRHGKEFGHSSACLYQLGCKSDVPFNGVESFAVTITNSK